MNDRLKITLFFVLVFSGVGLRLLFRDIPNFAPVAALSLFAGYFFARFWIAALVPVAVLTLSNIYFGGYENGIVMMSVYGCLMLPALWGSRLIPKDSNRTAPILPVLGCTFAGSLLFFFVTNYAAWLYWYPRNMAGFVDCYIAAIPFFKYTLMGDLFFGCFFFGLHALAMKWSFVPSQLITNSHQAS